MSTVSEIQQWCDKQGGSYWEYVQQCEGDEIWDYLEEVWRVMVDAVHHGLETEGIIPGGLGIRRKAGSYLIRANSYSGTMKSRGQVYAYALAVSEEECYRRQNRYGSDLRFVRCIACSTLSNQGNA